MSTTRKIAHNTITQIVGKIISTLLGLVAIGMMTRYLGTEQFGWYVTTLAFLQFIAILIDFGLIPVTASMMSEMNHTGEEDTLEKKKLLQNLLGYRFLTAVIFLGLAPFIALLFPYPHVVKIAIAFTTINMLATAMNQVLIGFYQTQLKMHIQAIGEVTGRIILIIGLYLIISRNAGFLPVMGIITLSTVSYTAVLWIRARKYTPIGFRFDWDIWKKITTKMWPIAISIMFNVVYLKGDTLLLTIFRSQNEVGLYGAAYRVIEILAQTAMMVMGLILPLLTYAWTSKNTEEFKQHYQRSFDSMMMLGVPITIGVIALADPIMHLIAGEEFLDAVRPLQILAVAVFGVYVGGVFGHVAVAIDKQKKTMWVYISNAIITLIGYLIFIPQFGMYGAAWMTVFSELYAGILLFLVVQHYVKEKLAYKTFVKILFSGAVMGLVLYFLRDQHIVLLVVISPIVYAGMMLATKAVSKETIQDVLMIKKGK